MEEVLDLQGAEESVEQIYRIAIDFLVNYSFQVIGALVILMAGMVVSRWVARLAVSMGERRELDVTHPPREILRGALLVASVAVDAEFRTILDREAETHLRCGQSADHAEGVKAFLERRKPEFTGR